MFITLEGTEGAGKSTALAAIESTLNDLGIEYITTREPGGCAFAEDLREAVLAVRDVQIDPYAELMTILAARRQHLVEVIEPALEKGLWVISDRYSDATFAYQCGGRKLAFETISSIERLTQTDRLPDHTLLLDLPVHVGLERARQRADLDRFEQEKVSFFEAIRDAYLLRAEQSDGRIDIVDASQSIEGVSMSVSQLIKSYSEGAVL